MNIQVGMLAVLQSATKKATAEKITLAKEGFCRNIHKLTPCTRGSGTR